MSNIEHRTEHLDAYETALLAELQTIVAEQAATAPAAPHRRRRLVAVAAALALVGAGAGALSLAKPTPAYALDTNPNGSVTLVIDRATDAAQLQADLAKHGIRAKVTYLSPGMVCAPGRYQEAPAQADDKTHGAMSIESRSADPQRLQLTLDQGMTPAGQTLVLDAAKGTNGWGFSVGTAVGPIGECVQVPAPLPPSNGTRTDAVATPNR